MLFLHQQKAFFPPDLASNSPTQGLSSDFLAPLEISPTLDRLVAMLASMHDTVRACGRYAFSLFCREFMLSTQ